MSASTKSRTRPQAPPPPPEPGSPWSLIRQIETHVGVLTVKDLVGIHGVHRNTIYEMMADGRIPTIQDGLEKKRVDPKTYVYVLLKRDPMMREAYRRG